MSRWALALCVAVALGASATRADEPALLVPEGESESILKDARWESMDSVSSVAFGPKGLLATGENNGTVRVWEISTGRLLWRQEGHVDAVKSLAFSRDGSTLASGSEDSTVRLWAVNTGRALRQLEGHTNFVLSLAFSPDGSMLASGGGDKTVRLWKVSTGEPLEKLAGPAAPSVSFSSEGLLQASGRGSTRVRQWDVRPGHAAVPQEQFAKDAQSPEPPEEPSSDILTPEQIANGDEALRQQPVNAAATLSATSPDGRLLAMVEGGKSVRLREKATGRLVRELFHGAPLQSLAFSSDGRTLAAGGDDATVRLWDIATTRSLRRLEANQPPVYFVAFSPDGTKLVSGGSDQWIHIWDPVQGLEVRRQSAPLGLVRSVAINNAGDLLAAGGDEALLFIFQEEKGPSPPYLSTLNSPAPHPVSLSPDGGLLLSGAADGTLTLQTVINGRSTDTIRRLKGPIHAVALSPDGETLASGGEDGSVRLYDVHRTSDNTSIDPREPLRGHKGAVRAVAFSSDGRFLASAGDDKQVRLWDVRTSLPVATLKGHSSSVKSVAFSPDKLTLATGGNKEVFLWNLETSRLERSLVGHTGWVTSLAFGGPKGLSLASSDDSGVIRLWAPAEASPARGVLRAAGQGWVSQFPGQPLRRQDDGSFLSRPREDGALEPIPPPRPDLPPRLSVASQEFVAPPEDFGAGGEWSLTLSNASEAGRAYWVRIEPTELPPGLRLLPPPPVERLEPGKSVEVRVGLSYLRPEGTSAVAAPRVRLKLADAFGNEFLTDALPLELRTPELRMVGEPQFEGGKALTVTLRNEGTQATGKFTVHASLQDKDGKRSPGAKSNLPKELGSYPYDSLKPGEERPFSITLPSAVLDAREFPLHLTADYDQWPRRWEGPTTPMKVPWPYATFALLALGAALLFGFVYYASVYLNPMVVRADKTPAALKSYPLAQMAAADQALRRARRRDSAITAAGIPVVRWERALRGAQEPHAAATAFAEAIGGRLGASLASNAWALSLPPLRLRFARDTAVVVIDGSGLESGEAERRMADVFQDGRGPGQVLVLDRTNAQNARQVLEGVPRVRSVVLSSNQLRDLLLADEPVRVLEGIISEQVAVSELSPYQVAGGVKLENLFFGREREIRAIVDRTVRNFLVVGQRQMGKSSLLLAVLRRLQARSDLDAQYVELADGDLHRRLARERERMPANGAPMPSFEEVAAGVPSRPRVWLIDEADDFISADAKAGYPVLQAMRALAEEGRAYFILAGFWDLYRAVVLDEKQPLRNFGEHLRLEPLDARSALALLTEPMSALALQWDAPSTPEFLVEQAGRRANLLVLACKALVESLPPDTHTLTREHLERVFREDKDLRDQGRRWRGDHPLHRAVVRQALLLGRPTREEVRQTLKARGADIRSVDFDEAMDHRELSYVLVPDGDGRLYCPVPLMQRYIEAERSLEVGLTEDLEDLRRRGLAEVPKPM
ncbi:nSTAND1 domain-containing NTPase [Hyalangium versicolor]|uniref:WD40 domain-containing protein n=1 Tax=Hyalangium versicolor TaxID=2861190 RepID=UPI001CCFA16D|nr:WD40 repeat domain-containing protein [Hyalangium versicolor]